MGGVHKSHSDIMKRVKRAQGHLEKVVEMIEAGEPCVKVAQQFHAVVGALAKAKTLFIHDHLEHCLDHVVEEDSPAKQKKQLKEFKEIYKYL